MFVVGAVAAWFVICALSRRRGRVSKDDAMLSFFIAIAGGLIGLYALRPITRIVEVAFNWERFAQVPAELFLRFIFGEAVFYGGLIGGLIAIFLFCRKYKMKVTPVMDLFAPGMALAHSIGRIGCLLAGCCHGLEVRAGHPLAVVYPPGAIGAPVGIPLLAVQPIEAAMLLILSSVLVILYLKTEKPGICVSVYLLVYPVGRFVLEFFRGDIIRGAQGMFSTSQYISMGMFALGVFCLVRTFRARRAEVQ